MMDSTESVMLPALDNANGPGVVWRSVAKLVAFINDSQCIDKDLHYSLKARLKSNDNSKILNTLTVYHSISLNCVPVIRQQLSDKKYLQVFSKVFSRSKDDIIRNGVMQLLMDWSFLFQKEDLGQYSGKLLQQFILRRKKSVRPTSLVAEIYQEVHLETPSTSFVKGFQFEYRSDQIFTEDSYDLNEQFMKSCSPVMNHGSFKFGSMKRLFSRSLNSRSLKASRRSSIVRELSIRGDSTKAQIENLLTSVPRDCKKLQDLLADVQVLKVRGCLGDVDSKMQVAESMSNKCVQWRKKLQEIVAMKIREEGKPIASSITSTSTTTEAADEMEIDEDDGFGRGKFAKLLSIGESLHMALADYEHIHHSYQLQMQKHHESHLVQNSGEDHGDSFVSVQSSSSAASIIFQSTGDFNWVDFSSGDAKNNLPPRASSSLSRSSSLGNGHSKTAGGLKPALLKATESEQHNGHSTSPSRNQDSRMSPLPYTSSSSAIPKPPPQTAFAGGSVRNAIRQQGPTLLPSSCTTQIIGSRRLQTTQLSQENQCTSGIIILDRHSKSFSDVANPQHAAITTKKLPNCPALKVRFTKDHLAEILDNVEKLR